MTDEVIGTAKSNTRAKVQVRFKTGGRFPWSRGRIEDVVIEGNLSIQQDRHGTLDIYAPRENGATESWHFPSGALVSFSASFWGYS